MVFYFSGTGNSLQAAKSIGDYNREKLISIAEEMNSKDGDFEYVLAEYEKIGFVFPVYAWGPPAVVLNFIEKLQFHNYKDNYVFSVVTCGENIGNTMKVLNKYLNKKGLELHSGFSIIMPNNYIIIGDVDSKEAENDKLKRANVSLQQINRIINEKRRGVFEVEKGPVPWVLTSVINPLFNKNAIDTNKFYVTDKCVGCGICEKVCNSNTIKVDGKPEWGKKCTQCMACIHHCPAKAIQYGKGTETKGRYTNPNVNINEYFNKN